MKPKLGNITIDALMLAKKKIMTDKFCPPCVIIDGKQFTIPRKRSFANDTKIRG